MSTFDQASLVMIPSGYKTSKVYSIKPTDGSGDLAFTRSNDTATRVGPDGLIEKVRTNLITYSNDFSNAAYSKITDGTYTITSETITDPFGNSVAVQKVTLTSGGYLVLRNALGTATTSPTTGSLYIKKTVAGSSISIDLSDASTATAANNTNWQRLVSINPASVYGSGTFIDINITSVNEPIYIAYAQIEVSDFGATDYIATTSAAVSVGPVANVPRLDYLNSSCPRLLLEPQRQNVITFSEQMDNAAWSKDAVSVSANASTSPDGYVNADSIVENSATGFHFIQQTFTSSAVSTTYSIFAKLGSGTRTLILREGVNTGASAAFNLSTGVVAAQSGGTATITAYANGYYRCTLTFTAAAGTSSMQIALSNSNSFASYTGNGTSSIILYGAQVEAGAYATSYIPTLGAAVTRGQESSSKTSASALIGQTEGTLYSEFVVNGFEDFGTALCLNNGSTNESIWLTTFANGTIRAEVYSAAGGGVQATFPKTGNVVGQTYKIAFGYAANNFAFFINGVQVGTTDTSGSVPVGLSRVDFDYTSPSVFVQSAIAIKQAIVFPVRLSNADLAALTA